MPFQVSPGVVTNEIDLTGIIPAVSTTDGALAGVFRWGPLGKVVNIDGEIALRTRFLTPTNFNAETWFTAANFLSYGSNIQVARAGDHTGNTVTLSYVGNATALAIQSNSNILTVGNTANLLVGMVLFSSNNTSLVDALSTSGAPTITAITNSTAVALSENAQANITSISATFRENVIYPAVAQELQDKTINWENQIVINEDEYHNVDGTFHSSVQYVARFGGKAGDSLRVSQCDTPSQYHSNTVIAANAMVNAAASVLVANVGSNTLTLTVAPTDTANATQVTAANTVAGNLKSSLSINDLVQVGNTRLGFQHMKVTALSNVVSTANVFSFTIQVDDEVKLGANVTHTNLDRYWEFFNLVDRAPGTSSYVTQFGNTAAQDELHVVVVDEDGIFTTAPGTVLEVYRNVSRATDAKGVDGGTNYYKDVINHQSQYIWWANDRSQATSNTAQFITSSTATDAMNVDFYGGSDGPDESDVPLATLTFAIDQFASPEDIDISLIMAGKARGDSIGYYTALANYIDDNICQVRKDCVGFYSPDKSLVVNNVGNEASDMVKARNVMRSTSYGVLDSGYKYQYDRYNDIYRWIPLNGDIAGLCARTDQTNDAWWSPAGFKRGQIKNLVRLAYNPRKADRDTLYKAGINPVVSFPGQGTILFGDKTMLAAESAFNRINVRRLFIVLEKAISLAAKQFLFEFNDDFTRAQFKAMVVPYLKDIQGRRGITDFFVKCDAQNNTADVVDRNEFKGQIFIKPARSINYIYLDFVAVRDSVAFSEVVGKV